MRAGEAMSYMILRQKGNEDLISFFKRIVSEMQEKKLPETVTLDCGEEIQITITRDMTFDDINQMHSKIFVDGFQERYENYLKKIAAYQEDDKID